jgi:hypothetical protein
MIPKEATAIAGARRRRWLNTCAAFELPKSRIFAMLVDLAAVIGRRPILAREAAVFEREPMIRRAASLGLMFTRLSLLIAAASFLATCAYPQIVSEAPEGVEIECAAGLTCRSSPGEIDAIAQDHCRKYDQNAQRDSMSSGATGKQWATYKCVPRPAQPH